MRRKGEQILARVGEEGKMTPEESGGGKCLWERTHGQKSVFLISGGTDAQSEKMLEGLAHQGVVDMPVGNNKPYDHLL